MARARKREVGVTENDMDVRSLEGLGPTSFERLSEDGVTTLRELVNRGSIELSKITKVEQAWTRHWIAEAEEKLRALGKMEGLFSSGAEMSTRAGKTEYVSTGSNLLDELLRGDLEVPRGGIETDAITEVFGKFGCGKTQLCLKLCAMAMLPGDKGGIDSHVIFIDGENIYQKAVERVHFMARSVGIEPDEFDRRITVVRPMSSDQLLESLKGCEGIIRETGARALVIDGAMSFVRHDYGILGRDGLAARSHWLNRWWGRLRRMTNTYSLMTFTTNQAQTNPGATFGDPVRAYGGDITSHTPTYILYLRKNSEFKAKSTAIMTDSPRHGRYATEFWLSRAGPCDSEPKGKFDPRKDGDPEPEKPGA